MENKENKEEYSKKNNLNSKPPKQKNLLLTLEDFVKNLREEEEELEDAFNKKDFKRFEIIKLKIQKTQRALSEELRKI